MSTENIGRGAGKLWARSGVIGRVAFFGGIAALLTMCFSTTPVEKKNSSASGPNANLTIAEPNHELTVEYVSLEAKAAAEAPSSEQKSKYIPTQWTYDTSIDKMSGKVARYASVDADDHLSFSFPYQGPNKPSLLVRVHPKYGTNVMLQIEKGQFICGYNDCSVMVRFDDKPAIRFTATEPADHSSTALFLSPAKKMIAGLKTSKIVHIQATFYQEGDHIMTFQTAGLEWK